MLERRRKFWGWGWEGEGLTSEELKLMDIFDWCGSVGAATIPYGGGSSVVGGVEPPQFENQSEHYQASVTIDLRHLSQVLEVDPVSEAARIQGGTCGPALEAQLKPSRLTLRHFPQG